MEAISNTDRLVLLLREKLAQQAKTRARGREKISEARPREQRDEVQAVVGKSARDGADDAVLRRILLEQLLTERLGESLANDAKFQQIVDQISETINADEELSSLLAGVVAEFKLRGALT